MFRLVAVLSAAMALTVIICGCDGSPTSSDDETVASAITYVFADHTPYYDKMRTESFRDWTTTVYGSVTADPMPLFEYVRVNEQYFSGSHYCTYYPRRLYFGGWSSGSTPITVSSGFDPIDISVCTSAGEVAGTMSLPVTISLLHFSEEDSLELGESLMVSWPGANADFYRFTLQYAWRDTTGSPARYEYADSLVAGPAVVVDGSFFSHDGVIGIVDVQPINGPYPEAGTSGNMSGEGTGFLYYSTINTWVDAAIVVGDGLDRSIAPSISVGDVPPATDAAHKVAAQLRLDERGD